MHIISKKKLREYYVNNSQAEKPLVEWYYRMKEVSVHNISELIKVFNASIDAVNGYTIFNIGGNNYRLIVAIHYNANRCYIREVWTHAEYNKQLNQKKLKKGDL